ncbi:MAG: TRAP transporter substrate-binding protein [Alphaproteobacteria bacterium]|nr:TRAP transporter substrate-binding protein [Alphaproteobacteria bacterium]
MRKILATALAVAAVSAIGIADVQAKTMKVQASSGSGDWAHRFMTDGWQQKVGVMTGGSLELEVLATKAVVPHRETIDAVANGILDGDLNAVSYFAGRDPAFGIIGDLIAGYDTPEQVRMFCQEGGGKEILQKLYDKHANGQVHVVGCGPYTKEALVAKVPIRTVEDLKGVKIRSPEGLAADVFRRAGAAPVSLPFSEVFTSLDKGIVDAADASAFVNNEASGMHKIAKFPIYPGIHSMAVLQFIVNKDYWEKLSEQERTVLEVWYVAAYTTMLRQADLQDRDLVAEYKKSGEVEIVDWSKEDRQKFREIAVAAWEDAASKSDLAREALDAHLSFMRRVGLLD